MIGGVRFVRLRVLQRCLMTQDRTRTAPSGESKPKLEALKDSAELDREGTIGRSWKVLTIPWPLQPVTPEAVPVGGCEFWI